jgi:hypothetical protein
MAKYRRRVADTTLQVRISEEMHRWLKQHALSSDTTMSLIINTYLKRLRATVEGRVKMPEV